MEKRGRKGGSKGEWKQRREEQRKREEGKKQTAFNYCDWEHIKTKPLLVILLESVFSLSSRSPPPFLPLCLGL